MNILKRLSNVHIVFGIIWLAIFVISFAYKLSDNVNFTFFEWIGSIAMITTVFVFFYEGMKDSGKKN